MVKRFFLIAVCLLLCSCSNDDGEKLQFKFEIAINNNTYFTIYESDELEVVSKYRDVFVKFGNYDFMDLNTAISENKFKINDLILKSNYIKNTSNDCKIYKYTNGLENQDEVYLMECPHNSYVIGDSLLQMEKYGFSDVPSIPNNDLESN